MNKLIAFSTISISCIAIYAVISMDSKHSDKKVSIVSVQKVEKDISKDTEISSIDDEALLEMPEDNFDISVSDEVFEVVEQKENISNLYEDIFTESSVDVVSEYLEQKEDILPISAIEIKRDSIKKIKINDTITLPFIDDAKYKAKISDKTVHQDGSVSVMGNLVGTDKKYSVVLTQGDKTSFGSITTPQGAFEIEVVNGKGYIYSVNDIDNKRIDYSKEDVIHVEGEG